MSIGFEIETTDLIKLTLTKDEMTDKDILVNSALTNVDLEYGYYDPDEYTYINDTKDETFKITNDAAEDSDFNELVEKIYYGKDKEEEGGEEEEGPEEYSEEYVEEEQEGPEEYDEEYDKDPSDFFVLKIPSNEYLPQPYYVIKFKENTGELVNYNPFTDTEFIATYYKPVKGYNIIKDYFFKSVTELSKHLDKLVTIDNSKMFIKNDNEEKEILMPINQSYVLPNNSLVYFNSSLYNIQNYNIKEDLKVVIQMTFSCNIIYCYRIMKKLLSIENAEKYQQQLEPYSTNEKVKQLSDKLYNVQNNYNYDDYAITTSMNIVNSLFKNYNDIYKNYSLDDNMDTTKFIKAYMFLIIYKLFIYLNFYVIDEDKPGNMLKKHLSFAVRHNNYTLFLELKKIINEKFFQTKLTLKKLMVKTHQQLL